MRTLGILLLDSFRMLRSQMLFWIVLLLSGIVALAYASVGVDEDGISAAFGLLKWENELVRSSDLQTAKQFYLLIFTSFIAPYWLNLIAIVLGLISCASIFPEFVKKGSIDLFLSKPPSRLALFVGKYLGSLLFVFLQVFLFTLIVFFSFGFRFDDWNFTVFWAVPVVVLIFSLIYCVHVFVSVWSGSLVFGLLSAFFVWGMAVLSEWTEDLAYKIVYVLPRMGLEVSLQGGGVTEGEPRDSMGETAEMIYRFTNMVRTPLPKTRVAANQLNRLVKVDGEDLTGKELGGLLFGMIPQDEEEAVFKDYQKRHPIVRDVATSLCFELFFVGLAVWVFSRRDY